MPSITDIKAALEAAVQDALANEVYQDIIETEMNAIEDVVYSAYSPAVYGRRGAGGGLQDPGNMIGRLNGLSISVTNETPANGASVDYGKFADSDAEDYFTSSFVATTGKSLPAVVEYGITSGYDFYAVAKDKSFAGARPFTAETIRDLGSSKSYVSALAAGLRRQGWNVK